MLISLSNDQKAFFEKEGYVALEGVLTVQEIERIRTVFQSDIPATRWDQELFGKQLFESGYDLFLKHKSKFKDISLQRIALIASELLDFHPIRYVFDQLCVRHSELPVQDTCSVTGCALVCCISLDNIELNKGSCLFVRADQAPKLDLGLHWILGLGGRNLQYLHNKKDPHTHALKNYGYGFGDALKQSTHPILFP